LVRSRSRGDFLTLTTGSAVPPTLPQEPDQAHQTPGLLASATSCAALGNVGTEQGLPRREEVALDANQLIAEHALLGDPRDNKRGSSHRRSAESRFSHQWQLGTEHRALTLSTEHLSTFNTSPCAFSLPPSVAVPGGCGSEPRRWGWNTVEQLSKEHEVWVLVHEGLARGRAEAAFHPTQRSKPPL